MHGLDYSCGADLAKSVASNERADNPDDPHKACRVRTWQNSAWTSAYVPSTLRPKQGEPKSRKLCASLGILPRQEHVDVELFETVNGHVS